MQRCQTEGLGIFYDCVRSIRDKFEFSDKSQLPLTFPDKLQVIDLFINNPKIETLLLPLCQLKALPNADTLKLNEGELDVFRSNLKTVADSGYDIS